MRKELPKQYDPTQVESQIYQDRKTSCRERVYHCV